MLAQSTPQKMFAPGLSKVRIWFALLVAVVTDVLQIGLGPFGWFWVDQGLDVIAMVLICGALGFHLLLLPTFAVEFIPIVEMLPTWTGCTVAVILLRKRAQTSPVEQSQTGASASSPPIDVESEVTHVPPRI